MKTVLSAALVAVCVSATPALAQSPLQVKVITAAPEGFGVNSTLVTGARDAVLIDAGFRIADARAIVDTIRASGKNLTTVYVTHDHPDHYFGLEVMKEAFPNARFVALPGALAEIQRTWKAKVDQWKPIYGDAITAAPMLPTALEGKTITLEGQRLEIVGPLQGDDAQNSFVWIPSVETVVTGDIVYSGVFVWTAETDLAARRRWAATLDRIAALKPVAVVPGHQQRALAPSPANVAFTKEYLAAFDRALASSATPEQLQEKVKSQYPSLALDIILKIGSEAALPRRSGR